MQDTACSFYPNAVVNLRLVINDPRQVNQRGLFMPEVL
jgi:hypothetical protein